MKCMPFWKGCNRHVDYLDRSHRGLSQVPYELHRYARCLEELLLDGNLITNLPQTFYQLQQLRRLTLSDNRIVRLSPDVANFAELQELDISHNELGLIPEKIKMCENLQVANFSSNPLQRIPSSLTQLRNLTQLSLNDVAVSELPPNIGNLTNLESLEIRDNMIRSLPPSAAALINLRFLDAGGNLLDRVPSFIGNLRNLLELRLDCNEIQQLPAEIAQLRKLTELDVSENKLVRLPPELGRLTSLTDLGLSYNHLEQLPESIGHLRRLCTLKVDQNRLLQLPATIGQCLSLQELVLTENILMDIPSTIGQLKSLVILNVDRNQLTALPPEVGSCLRLGVLSLRDNSLCQLPPELGNLRHLHVLDVSGNRLLHLPVSLGSCDLKAVWLSESQAQPLVSFQQDTDVETGEQVLTCFLLPQLAYTGNSDDLSKDSFVVMDDDSRASWMERPRTSVKFDVKDTDVQHHSESAFVRRDTPRPKDLRERRSQFLSSLQEDSASTDPKPAENAIGQLESRDLPLSPNQMQPVSVLKSQKDTTATESSVACSTTQEPPPSDDTLTESDESDEDFDVDSDENPSYDTLDGSGLWPICDTNSNDILPCSGIVVRVVRRPGTALGMSIAGGRGSTPFIGNDESIFVSRVTPEGACERAGLRLGDKLLSVNGVSLISATHYQAVAVIKSAGNDMTMVVVKATTPPTDRQRESPRTNVVKEMADNYNNNYYNMNDNNKLSSLSTSDEARTTTVSSDNVAENDTCDSAVIFDDRTVADNVDSLVACVTATVTHSTVSATTSVPATSTVVITESVSLPEGVGLSQIVAAAGLLPSTGPANNLSPTHEASNALLHVSADSQLAEPYPVERVTVTKRSGSLGMSIIGGRGQTSHPFGIKEPGIFISKIVVGGAASETSLQIGDRILAVNDVDVRQSTHHDAVVALISAPSSVVIDVRRDPQPPGLQEIQVNVRDSEDLGVMIRGGIGSQCGNPFDVTDEGIFISEIVSDSVADQDARLKVGQRILEVNGESLLGARHKHAVGVLRSLGDNILFLVCDGYAGSDLPQSVAAKVNQGHELQCQGHKVVMEKMSQGRGLAVEDQEMVTDAVIQGHGLVFQGCEKVSGVSEPTADEERRERARQRRLARMQSQQSTSKNAVASQQMPPDSGHS